ncbi:MAG TPA: (2Fe-2S) ferredoxin domain-containing protein, partial [Thermosynechococcaceae cyanobacterium]
MGKTKGQVLAFSWEGRFLGFGTEDGFKLKQIRLLTAEGERYIKLSKEARGSIVLTLVPGDWIQVWGEQSVSPVETKLRAHRIAKASPTAPAPYSPTPHLPEQPRSPKPQQILMCQKSTCMKRGGKAVCQALEQAIDARGLGEQVTIRGTGCMKNCKAGPNLVMPDKTRYCRIEAREVAAVVAQHFPAPPPLPQPASVQPVPVLTQVLSKVAKLE